MRCTYSQSTYAKSKCRGCYLLISIYLLLYIIISSPKLTAEEALLFLTGKCLNKGSVSLLLASLHAEKLHKLYAAVLQLLGETYTVDMSADTEHWVWCFRAQSYHCPFLPKFLPNSKKEGIFRRKEGVLKEFMNLPCPL